MLGDVYPAYFICVTLCEIYSIYFRIAFSHYKLWNCGVEINATWHLDLPNFPSPETQFLSSSCLICRTEVGELTLTGVFSHIYVSIDVGSHDSLHCLQHNTLISMWFALHRWYEEVIQHTYNDTAIGYMCMLLGIIELIVNFEYRNVSPWQFGGIKLLFYEISIFIPFVYACYSSKLLYICASTDETWDGIKMETFDWHKHDKVVFIFALTTR